MNKFLLSLTLLMFSGVTFADSELREEYEKEQTWTPVRVAQENQSTALVSGYLTDGGGFRISELSESAQAKIVLSSSKFTTQSKLEEACFETRGRLDKGSLKRAQFELKLPVPQLSFLSGQNTYLVDERGNREILPVIENRGRVTSMTMNVSLGSQSYTERNYISKNEIAMKLEELLSNNHTSLERGEWARVSVTRMPSLVCDLNAGKVKLSAEILYSYEQPKLNKRRTLHASELQELYKDLQRGPSIRSSNSSKSLVLSGAALADSVRRVWRKDVSQVGTQDFLRIHESLYASPQKSWKSLSEYELRNISNLFFELYPRKEKTSFFGVTYLYDGKIND